MHNYDVIAVGAGPSSLMAVYELATRFGKAVSIGIFDKGEHSSKRKCQYSVGNKEYCRSCDPCGITDGTMGAGLKTDGKVHFHKEVMELWRMGLLNDHETESSLRYIESCLEKWGLEGPVFPINQENAEMLSAAVLEKSLGDFFELKVKKRTRHIGSDRLPRLVDNMIDDIYSKGNVEFHTRSEMVDYDYKDGRIRSIRFKEHGRYEEYGAKKILIGLGRKGSRFVQEMIETLGIDHSYRPVEIGGRVEVPAEVIAHITESVYNPCFRQKRNGLATFTFCTNPNGYITTESICPGIVGVNGESRASEKSGYTNFAILTEVPVGKGEHPNDKLVHILHDKFTNVVKVQTTRDFVNGTLGDENNRPEGTLRGAQYADISRCFPEGITAELRNILNRIEVICPSVVSDKSLFLAPEPKIRGMRVLPKDSGLETSVPGLYLIGELSGLSGNIVASALTGLMAARDIAI